MLVLYIAVNYPINCDAIIRNMEVNPLNEEKILVETENSGTFPHWGFGTFAKKKEEKARVKNCIIVYTVACCSLL